MSLQKKSHVSNESTVPQWGLSWIRRRFPPREDLILVLCACIFIIHLWAYFAMLEVMPAWLMRMNVADMAGTISYVLVFALFESILVWSVLVIIAWALSDTWFQKHFVTSGTIFLVLLSSWFVVFNLFFTNLISQQAWNRTLIILAAAASAFGLSFLVSKIQKLDSIFRTLLGYLVVLSSVYVLLDLIALMVVIIRNLIS